MGLYFNSEATIEMVAMVNGSFQQDNLEWWKSNHKDKFDKNSGNHKKLSEIADSAGLLPGKMEDKGKQKQKKTRWIAWLNWLHDNAPSPALGAYATPAAGETKVTQYAKPPFAGPGSNVGDELRQLILQGLSDQNCKEIVFTVLPDANYCYVMEARTIDLPGPNSYYLAITVCSIEMQ